MALSVASAIGSETALSKANDAALKPMEDTPGEPVMIMWWKSGRFSGLFTYRGRMYTLRSMGDEVEAVVETEKHRKLIRRYSGKARPGDFDRS